MTFEEILPHLRAGRKVRRTSWHQSWSRLQEYIWFENTPYSTFLCRLFGRNSELTADDLNATDWELYE